MSTVIVPEVTKENKYYISKHRYYELKHFCLQYPEWRSKYEKLNMITASSPNLQSIPVQNSNGDKVLDLGVELASLHMKMDLIGRICEETDPELKNYIFKSVTQNLAYTYFETHDRIPCSRGTFYDRYRRFFWLLDQAKE